MQSSRGFRAGVVIAPVSPVDDLSSAVFVTQAVFRFCSEEAETALSAALADAHCDEWIARLEGGGIASRLRPYVATTW
jgi:hypothetical protein